MQPHHTAHISHMIERLCTLNVLKIDTSIIAQERASLLARTKLLKSCSMWQIGVYKALIKSRCTVCEITQNRKKLFFFFVSLFFFLSQTHDNQITLGLKTQAFVPRYYFFQGLSVITRWPLSTFHYLWLHIITAGPAWGHLSLSSKVQLNKKTLSWFGVPEDLQRVEW